MTQYLTIEEYIEMGLVINYGDQFTTADLLTYQFMIEFGGIWFVKSCKTLKHGENIYKKKIFGL
jgi:hypothetical protein